MIIWDIIHIYKKRPAPTMPQYHRDSDSDHSDHSDNAAAPDHAASAAVADHAAYKDEEEQKDGPEPPKDPYTDLRQQFESDRDKIDKIQHKRAEDALANQHCFRKQFEKRLETMQILFDTAAFMHDGKVVFWALHDMIFEIMEKKIKKAMAKAEETNKGFSIKQDQKLEDFRLMLQDIVTKARSYAEKPRLDKHPELSEDPSEDELAAWHKADLFIRLGMYVHYLTTQHEWAIANEAELCKRYSSCLFAWKYIDRSVEKMGHGRACVALLKKLHECLDQGINAPSIEEFTETMRVRATLHELRYSCDHGIGDTWIDPSAPGKNTVTITKNGVETEYFRGGPGSYVKYETRTWCMPVNASDGIMYLDIPEGCKCVELDLRGR